ncbi:MAG: hypothetical protein Q6366_010505 [Candidatus Freyarchaeota archaeon]
MIPVEEKKRMWKKASKDFPSDPMMRDLHFIRELIFALKKKEEGKTYTELSEIAREEFIDWLKVHPKEKRPETKQALSSSDK